MTGRAAAGATDGIVTMEAALDEGEAESILAALRVGCAAWEATPTNLTGLVAAAVRVEQVRRFAGELAAEIDRAREAREAAHRAEAKAAGKAAR